MHKQSKNWSGVQYPLKFNHGISLTRHSQNTPTPTPLHTCTPHKAKLNKYTVGRSRYRLCLDGPNIFFMNEKVNELQNKKIHVAMVTAWINLMTENESILPLIPWMIMLFTHLLVILSEGLPHIICCDDSSGSWEKSNQHKIYYIKYYFASQNKYLTRKGNSDEQGCDSDKLAFWVKCLHCPNHVQSKQHSSHLRNIFCFIVILTYGQFNAMTYINCMWSTE